MNNTPLEDQVHDALHRTADPLHRSPLTVGDVRTRARRIQRRRTAAAGVVAAAVLAVAVPVGLDLAGPSGRDSVQPATQPSVTPVTGTVRIDPRSAPRSDTLGVSLLDVDGPSLVADGTVTELPSSYDQLTPYLDGWIGAVNTEGAYSLRQLDADFRVLDEIPTSSRMALSADGTRIAWAEHDGTHWRVVDVAADGSREERRTQLPQDSVESHVEVVGFVSDTEVLVTQTDPADGAITTLRVDGSTATPVPGFVRPWTASAATGVVAGVTEVHDDLSSCSGVVDARSTTGTPAWTTCDHTLASLSPDGRYVAGLASYLDGYGSPTLAILDAATGEVVVDFELIGPTNTILGINDRVVWEDEDDAVVTMVSGDRQYVLRLGVDGTVERITAPGVELAPGAVSLTFAAR
ncbi:hypothetical protein [Nocardioides currus]|uniref:WD40 repeat domain-containing protein n=1 Tax=Nocardioides currus TaxID=2133958 RepID=A0A2R7Z1W7_9ACTN|nr:hypothetical protein [Nocardioides currus]PUA82246.1 hypothetical protein C7S10_00315 [Nocardioides currus]